MTPEDLRADVPVCDRAVYLNTGATGPAPRRVVDATTGFVEYHEHEAPAGEGGYRAAYEAFDEARAAVAAFLGADPGEIALTQSTADGISRVAAAIDWAPGDVVVRTDIEHAAGVVPWWHLERQGVETRVLGTEDGRLDIDDVAAAVDDARLICLNSLTWSHGTRLPVAEVVEIAHEAGCRVLVDAVQSPGQRPVDLSAWDADFVAGAGHKWLLGPWGAGFLYVNADRAADVVPAQANYRSVVDPGADALELKPDAARFEVGTTAPAPYVGLVEAMSVIEEVGMGTITDRIARLTDRLKDGLGETLLSPREYESGLVTFEAPAGESPERTVERLADEGVVIRSLPSPEALRASVHAFNTADDVDALLDAL
jgi:selenocysteine lyase/cysteine desulfurase